MENNIKTKLVSIHKSISTLEEVLIFLQKRIESFDFIREFDFGQIFVNPTYNKIKLNEIVMESNIKKTKSPFVKIIVLTSILFTIIIHNSYSQTYIKGNIEDLIGAPISDAKIYIKHNGIFVSNATTNKYGYYSVYIDNISEFDMLIIYDRTFKTISNIQTNGKEIIVQKVLLKNLTEDSKQTIAKSEN